MKKITLLVCLFLLVGCAHTNNKVSTVSKTDDAFTADDEYCHQKSGKITGFWAFNPISLAINLSGANKRYNQCMKDFGWPDYQ